ncbi:MAG: SipW-dependent-type signal peptide-containing protein [Acidimicrobiia bacterium]|nr:SipW-dependent-type signal peptide-containing protein [Acidimicrobiia bacterium]
MTNTQIPIDGAGSLSDSHVSSGRPRATGTKILASLAVLALAGGVFTVASLALFTDQQAVGGNAFTTGSVDLVAAPATAVVTASAMAPGDQVTAPINVDNSGSLEFRYSLTSTTDEDTLASELVLTVKSGVATCDDTNWQATGAVLYSGVLGSTGTINVVGDPAVGTQAGDRVLAAAANENLCFNVTLPTGAPNTAQGLTSTATFTFDAEQTANNP